MAKSFQLQLGPRGRTLLAEALRSYTEAAYPPGGSECTQVARETLLTTADRLEQLVGEGAAEASVRQRAMLRAAVRWYLEQLEELDQASRERLDEGLQRALGGELCTDEMLFDES